MRPALRPHQSITLVSNHGTTLYSGMVPALIAGVEKREKASINLRWLAQQAGVSFVQATAKGISPQGDLQLLDRPNLGFGFLSLNLGAVTRRQGYQNAIAIKPLEPALRAISSQDAIGDKPNTDPFHCVGAAPSRRLALRQRWPKRPQSSQRRPSDTSIHGVGAVSSPTSSATNLPLTRPTRCFAPAVKLPDGWPKGLCDAKGRVLTQPSLGP